MVNERFSRLEDQIQRLVEGGFARLFADRLHPRDVLTRLAHAMEDRSQETETGDLLAPDVYIVRLNPQDHEEILASGADLVDQLADELVKMARSADLKLISRPRIRLLADLTVEPHDITVSAQHTRPKVETTQAMPLKIQENQAGPEPPKAALIVDGERHIPLAEPVLNIGRQRDNHLILDEPEISRHHIQIRLRFGRYVLFDLTSKQGTLVNANPVQEHILQPGDVITLANHSLIYVEEDVADDDPGAETLEKTQSAPGQTEQQTGNHVS
ncbi:MAG: FHA domain-containing protein [Anaerolineae bacterium]|nr:FHA domain-containing protein [Anaerolineae bacterium]